MPERLECEVLQKARYINTLTYLPTGVPYQSIPLTTGDILAGPKK